jgi:hypothetical protein
VIGPSEKEAPVAVTDRADWTRLIIGLVAIYELFQWSAARLGSDRGQAGLAVAGIVVSATLSVEFLWFDGPSRRPSAQWGLDMEHRSVPVLQGGWASLAANGSARKHVLRRHLFPPPEKAFRELGVRERRSSVLQ